ncbi:hypothetical protein GCM10025867_41480 [Frondihabitans sucicola]|uniref:Uncharacterized protein n=1 Tax=Frondihabitans sucicola TaxID=1268041 RepID=A0ABN6Y3K0_9MICO|nr:hypothetical protein GCM10025867_41480 [Frondihabitans sucicola]
MTMASGVFRTSEPIATPESEAAIEIARMDHAVWRRSSKSVCEASAGSRQTKTAAEITTVTATVERTRSNAANARAANIWCLRGTRANVVTADR